MRAFYEISGLNIYIQILVTIISIAVHLFNTRNKERKESTLEIIAIYTFGLSGWFTIMSGLFGHLIYADQVAAEIGWPLNSGFQMELGFASIGIGIVGFLDFWNRAYWLPFILMKFIFGWRRLYTHFSYGSAQQLFTQQYRHHRVLGFPVPSFHACFVPVLPTGTKVATNPL